ncbi:MAG: PAS domain-containing sensor histidine kinase [Bdellovibrionota bacterium]
MMKRRGILQIIAEEAIMGIAVFDADGHCFYLNKLAREVLEIPSEGDFDLQLSDIMAEDRSGIARGFKPEMLANEGLYQDIFMRKKNGHMLLANVGVKHARLDDVGPVSMVMFQDITIQKKLQREVQAKQDEINKAYQDLLEQNRQLKELDRAKDKFIALTTHELRTPLSAIVATAEVLTLKLYETEAQKEEFIQTILDQGLHLMELVNDILDFAKIRAGKMDFYVEQVDLRPLVRRLVSNFDHMASANDVTMKVVVPDQPVMAWTDVLRLKEAVNNVVNNAIKYNRKGGSVTITIGNNGSHARVTVTDTGLGIPADKLKHVFNEFETVGHVSAHHKGTGLGMPISRKLMQNMGGDLTLESVADVGSSFFIDVPAEKVLSEDMYRSRPDSWGDQAA